MNARSLMLVSGAAAGCLTGGGVAAEPEPVERPNILFLLGDDVVSRVWGCYGGKLAKTPVVDQLASEGVLFENSFVTTSICAVSRACILSGQHQRTTGIKDFNTPFTTEAFSRTYPMLMKQAGYRVGFIGKWGVGADLAKMKYPSSQFDYWRGLQGQAGYWYDDDGLIWQHARTYEKPDGNVRHEADQFPDYLREFLEQGDKGQPWCFSVSFKSVHPPRAPYPSLRLRFEGDELPPLAETCAREAYNSLPDHVKSSYNGFNQQGGRSWLDFWKEPGFRKDYACYLRSIESLDMTIGRLLAILKEKGLDRNTVILFHGDNGHLAGEKGMVGKWLMYEPSIRVPTVLYDPRLPAGSRGLRLAPMALNIDLAPTMLEWAGVARPASMQGESLLPLIRNPEAPWRKDWYYEHTYRGENLEKNAPIAKSEGVRSDRWKYIRWLDPKPHVEELFDLKNDPDELHNLAQDPAFQTTLQQMRERYQYWRKSLPDNAPDPDEYAGNPIQ